MKGCVDMKYKTRIIDEQISKCMKAFNAVNIVGPKGCGKTRTAKERCKTIIEFQDEEKRDAYISTAETAPSLLLANDKPILFDEWQDAPKIFGSIRKYCDDNPSSFGEFYLTGSSSKKVKTPHTGTGRIAQMTMYPMTLFETEESNGSISLESLFSADYTIDGKKSSLDIRDLIYAACRGGWPRCLEIDEKEAKLEVAKYLYRQIYNSDISAIDDIQRNPELARIILWSYARNVATLAKQKTIFADVQANIDVSDKTFASYVDALQRLFVIKDIDAWTPQIRSKTAIRSSKKHIFIDPSLAIASLGLSPKYFNNDMDLFGHIFENLVIRDLLAYAEVSGATVKHYSDDNGLEIDAIYQLADGRYALIEIKNSLARLAEAEKNLIKFKNLILKHNEVSFKNKDHPEVLYREPSAMILICANLDMAFTTESGIKIVPIGCLKG